MAVPVLVLVAVVGLLVYLGISSSASFKDTLFSFLYPKEQSYAAEAPGSVWFVDKYGNVITQTTSPSVKLKYVLPDWGRKPSVSGPITKPTPPTVTTKSIVLAEDRLFRKNVKTVGVGTTGPIDYTFSNSTLGKKNLYVKFIASNNKEQNAKPFPLSIQLIAPTPTPPPVCEHPAPPPGCHYEGTDVYPKCALYLVCSSPTPTPSSTPTSTPTPSPISSKRVFVTSTTYNGNLGGLTGADAKCQERANTANLGGTWKAWISDNTTSAASSLTHHSGSYKLIDGTTIANNWSDLIDGAIQSQIAITEFGTPIVFEKPMDGWVRTNTNTNGTSYGGSACSNLTSNDGGNWGLTGYAVYRDNRWTNDTLQNCANVTHLYCFEQTSPTSYSYPTPYGTPYGTPGTPQ